VSELILVKHSLPIVDPARPAREWVLGEEGLARAERLAAQLAALGPSAAVVSSPEPKALATARVLAARWGAEVEIVPDLREHDRENVPFLSAPDFEARVQLFFDRPDALVLGRETAPEALERFARAIAAIVEPRTPNPEPRTEPRTSNFEPRTVIVVTHGTVMALFAAACAGIEPFPLWQRLGLPSYIVFGLPELTVREIVERVD
jgi:broad specificity phosphatase PhoE